MFNVSYEIITQESAEQGDISEHGFISEGVGLREAIEDLFATRTSQVDCITGIEDHIRWFTVDNGMEYLTGAYESRSLHLPENITQSSVKRIWRLINT